MSPICWTYSEKSSGPSTEPCGTSAVRVVVLDDRPPITKKPQRKRNRLIRIPWLIVSKAALKSTRTKVVSCLLSMAVLMALVKYSSAVSDEYFFQYAD